MKFTKRNIYFIFLEIQRIIDFGGIIMQLTVYLAGEIHTNWREELKQMAKDKELPLSFVAPQTNHDRSDDIGEAVLGEQPGNLYKDHAASNINNFRTQVMLQKADIVIALFGEQYRQWNTAMDANAAITRKKPTIIIRPESLIHPSKELSNKANVTVVTVEQALQVLENIYE